MLATWAALVSACALQQATTGAATEGATGAGTEAAAAATPQAGGGTFDLGAALETRELLRREPFREEVQEAELVPRLRLGDETQRGAVSLAYFPRLVASSARGGSLVLHQVGWTGSYATSRTAKLLASIDGSLGKIDLLQQQVAGLVSPTTGTTQQTTTVPQRTLIDYEAIQGSVGFSWQPSPRETLSGTALYALEGGANRSSRQSLPLQYGPRATLRLTSQVTRLDALDTLLDLSQRTFGSTSTGTGTGTPPPTSSQVWIAQLSESWRRRFLQGFDGWLGAGVGATGAPRIGPAIVTGNAGLQVASADERSRLRLDLGYVPFIDPVTGRAYPRLQGTLGGVWGPTPSWRFSTDAGGGAVLKGIQQGQANLFGEARATWVALEELELALGARVMLQWPAPSPPSAPNASQGGEIRQWVFFLAANGNHRLRF